MCYHVHVLGKRIAGEIYEVDGAMLAKLDRLEGHPDYYMRRTIQVELTPAANAGTVSTSDTDTGTGTSVLSVEAYLLPATHFSEQLLTPARTDACLNDYTREIHSVYIPPEQRPDGARAEILAAVADTV